MGKAQYKKRIRSARQHASALPLAADDMLNPIVDPSDKPSENSSGKSSKKLNGKAKERQGTLAVLEKVTSSSSNDKIWSLAAVSNLVLSSATTRQLLLSKNLINLLINCLKENQDHKDVLVEATGVLRNLVIEGGKDVCGEMANKGLLQPLNNLTFILLASFTSIQESLRNQTIDSNGIKNGTQQALDWAQLVVLSENLITILWSFAETSNKLLNSVNNTQELVPLLLLVIDLFSERVSQGNPLPSKSHRYALPSSLALASAQCLYTLTEDNPKLVKQLTSLNETKIQPLLSIFASFDHQPEGFSTEESEDVELFKIVIAGILRNIISQSKQPQKLSFKSDYDEKIPQLLISKLQVDLNELAKEAAEANETVPSTSLSDLNIAKASVQAPSAAELKLESTERRLTIVQLSLELLGEWCASADGFEGDDESSSACGASEQDRQSDSSECAAIDGQLMENGNKLLFKDADVVMDDSFNPDNTAPCDHPDAMDQDLSATDDNCNQRASQYPTFTTEQTHSNLFSKLLSQLGSLAPPTPYLYQSPESCNFNSKTIIPTSASVNTFIPNASTGCIPALINEILSGIHVRAIDAINNMVITLDRLGTTAPSFVSQFISNNRQTFMSLWTSCFSTAHDLVQFSHLSAQRKDKQLHISLDPQKSLRDHLLLSVVTCIWTFSRVLLSPQNKLHVAPAVVQGQVECLMEILKLVEEPEIKVRAVSALAAFGCRPNVSIKENEIIGGALMDIISNFDILSSDVPAALLVAALDGVFDIYADETREYDGAVFRQRYFLKILQSKVPTIKALVKKIDKRKEPLLRQQAEDAQTNLSEFIKYRHSLGVDDLQMK
ncbi:hypothetical protein O181_001213 [Austropuccinia psidii MF-1]|uniref:SYO1-like TPR repeats domain-containing protein n=1 Tax=Austropuccinia psidii MF-1 TaxID=1389203 RepID=A0A9Q3GBI2_9BASI|nr:hypothetical protein [Austropuccinia psidii MF-1]